MLESIKSKNIEEYYNILTHAAGAVLAVPAMLFLLSRTSVSETDFKFVSVLIFGLCSIMLYVSSALYHYNFDRPFRKIYRTLDHIFIFYLIAGSYTPFLLINFSEDKGWRMFLLVWVFAFLGTLFKFFFTGKFNKLSVLAYVGMGWLVLLEAREFLTTIPPFTITLILAGGLLYLVGLVFYLKEEVKFNHAIWHVFVVAANFIHFMAVYTIL